MKKIISIITISFLMTIFTAAQSYAEKVDLRNIKTLDLETAKKIAVSGNPSIKAVKERIKQANEQVKQAISSFSPSFDYSGYVRKYDLSDTSDIYSSTLSATLNLFNGFKDIATLKNAELEKSYQIQADKNAQRTLIYSVAQSFYNAQTAKESIRIEEENRSYNMRQLKDAQNKRKVGKASLSDELNFQIEVNAAQSSLIEAKKEYKIAMTGLAALLGIKNARFPETLELSKLKHIKKTATQNLDELVNYALNNRPDVKQYGYLVKKADKSITIARSDYYPSLDLTYSHTGSNSDSFDYGSDDYTSYTQLSLSFNIFSGFITKSNVAEAKASKKEAQQNYNDTKINLRSDISQAIDELKAAGDKYKLQQSNVKLHKINRDLVEKEFKAGKKSLVSLNEAQKNYVKASSELVKYLISVKSSLEKIDSLTAKNLLY